MGKTIWIINQYASTPSTGMGGRHYYLARELALQGNKVYLIAASYTHLLRVSPDFSGQIFEEEVDGFEMVWLKMPRYTEAHSPKRVLNWFLFAKALTRLPRYLEERPDVIYYSSLSLVGFLGAEWLAKKLRSPLVFEVRDIWPMTLVELGGKPKSHPFVRFLQWVEDRAYQKSNVVFSNLQNAVEHMVDRGMPADKFHWMPNGICLEEVQSNEPLADGIAERVPLNKFVVGYTGTIGVANSMDVLIEAAAMLKDRDDICFVLVGGGKEKCKFEEVVARERLSNVIFIPPIPKASVQSMLKLFDTCYLGAKKEPLYRYGLGANKIPEYLYSGKPLLLSYTGAGDPTKLAKVGISAPAEDPEMLAQAVVKLAEMKESERDDIKELARKIAVEEYDYANIAKSMMRIFNSL